MLLCVTLRHTDGRLAPRRFFRTRAKADLQIFAACGIVKKKGNTWHGKPGQSNRGRCV